MKKIILFALLFSLTASANFKKVMIVVLENTNYENAVKQAFQSELAAQGALLTNYSGVTHPSQPNYIAMVSGSTHAVIADGNVTVPFQHVGDLLEAKGMNWKAYAEDYPGNCFLGKRSGDYARKHVPFLSFANIQNNFERCNRHIVNSDEFMKDYQSGKLPEYSMYVPNLKNDGHDTNAIYSDKWLEKTFGPILRNKSLMKEMLFVLTYDESEKFLNNRVFTVFVGSAVKKGVTNNTPYNHYSLLRTIEEALNIGSLGFNDLDANPIRNIWTDGFR